MPGGRLRIAVAAMRALQDPEYYAARWTETHALREELRQGLEALVLEVVPGVGNFLLFHLPDGAPDAATVVRRCRKEDVFLRDAGATSAVLGDRALRTAVKDRETNARILRTLARAIRGPRNPGCGTAAG